MSLARGIRLSSTSWCQKIPLRFPSVLLAVHSRCVSFALTCSGVKVGHGSHCFAMIAPYQSFQTDLGAVVLLYARHNYLLHCWPAFTSLASHCARPVQYMAIWAEICASKHTHTRTNRHTHIHTNRLIRISWLVFAYVHAFHCV